MSDTMTEGTLVRWLKREGDVVRIGDPVAEIETDKAVMEVEAAASGVLLKCCAEPAEVVQCGSRLGWIGELGEVVDEVPSAVEAEGKSRKRSSPAARKLAVDRGVDLTDVTGSGPGGRVVMRDIPGKDARTGSMAARSNVPGMHPARARMISRLETSHRDIPAFTLVRRICMDGAREFRHALRSTETFSRGIGVTELCIACAARAMVSEPRLNARYERAGITFMQEINIGIAVGMEDYVVVPVLRNCGSLQLLGIADEFRRLVTAAQSGSLLAEDARNSTFTVSNLGAYGIEQFTAVINPPEAAILAVGMAKPEAVVADGDLKIAEMMTVTLTVDHRVADGIHAARWLASFAEAMENPARYLSSQ
jgi:pyruvate dehydrogenase E2 component (dihydrolipoamide acetyltransferase)